MVTLLLIVITGSLLAGWLAGGRLTNIERLKLKFTSLVWPALVAGLLPLFVTTSRSVATALLALAYLLVAAFLALNVRRLYGLARAGMIVVLCGWLLNAAPIAANGAMPLSLWAYRRAGFTDVPTPRQGGFYKVTIADGQTRLRMLGDTIPVPPIRQVVSAGDLILILGIGVVVVAAMRDKANSSES